MLIERGRRHIRIQPGPAELPQDNIAPPRNEYVVQVLYVIEPILLGERIIDARRMTVAPAGRLGDDRQIDLIGPHLQSGDHSRGRQQAIVEHVLVNPIGELPAIIGMGR